MITKLIKEDNSEFDLPQSLSNYYHNLFNILLMIDCNKKEGDKNVVIFYIDKNDLYYSKDEKDINAYVDILLNNNVNKIFRYDINDEILFNPNFCIFKITESTFDLLIESKVLELDYSNNYDIILRKLNELILIAQDNLEKYLKSCKDNDYKVYELYNDCILKYYNKDNNKLYDTIYKIVYDVRVPTKYTICMYNELFNIYLDTLKLITIYTKYITKFQLVINNDYNINDKVKFLINNLGIFYSGYSCIFKDLSDLSDIVFNNVFIKNGSSFQNAISLKSINRSSRYSKSAKKDNIFLNTMYSIPNSIFNLYSFLDEINRIIRDTNMSEIIELYKPKFNDLSKSKTLSIVSKIMNDSVKITKLINGYIKDIVDHFNEDINIDNMYKTKSYGENIKYSSTDSNDMLTLNNKTYCGDPFEGYIQNSNCFNFKGSRVQYKSSVWIKPLYKNKSLASEGFEDHLIIKNTPIIYQYYRNNNSHSIKSLFSNRNSYFNDLNSIVYNIESYRTNAKLENSNIPLLERYELDNDSSHLSNVDNNNNIRNIRSIDSTVYVTSLGSVFLLRSYIIGILEMISRYINDDSLKKIDDKKELTSFKNAYKINKSYNIVSMASDFKNSSICNSMKYYEGKFIHGDYYIDRDRVYPLRRLNYANTFYSFFMDALNINASMLEKISTIAKEDYLSCPMI